MKALSGIWPFLLLFSLIIGGLYAKLFTPTEAAGMGAGLALLIATPHGRLSWSVLRKVILDTAYTSVSLYTVLFGALMLSKLLTMSGLAADVPVVRIFKGLVPFIAVDVVRLALLVAFPAITLWLGSTVS